MREAILTVFAWVIGICTGFVIGMCYARPSEPKKPHEAQPDKGGHQ